VTSTSAVPASTAAPRPGEPLDPDAAISVRGLVKRYGTATAVDGLDLDIRRGEIFALLGPNGAGKTTTVEICEGFRDRDGGEVRVLGTDPATGGRRWKAKLGIVLQSGAGDSQLTCRELLQAQASYYPDPRDPDEVLALVGLTEKAKSRGRLLSGGQRRRLDVAIGIVGRPELLFLDEPTAGFDPQARREFHQLVQRLASLEHTTVLLTTHDLDEAERLADRVLILAGGRIVADDTPDGLARRVAGAAEVRWSVNGERLARQTDDPTGFVRDLFAQAGDAVRDLDIRRASLEDAYLSLVQQHEAGHAEAAARLFKEVTR
jgi:ABC-2 type transport system ATP-binding protein